MRIKCTECENMVLPATAKANEGLCAQCVKIPPEIRKQAADFDQALKEGKLWTPSAAELSSAKTPAALGSQPWRLQPDYYKAHAGMSLVEVVANAATSETDEVYLVSDAGSCLNVALNRHYGVCEYQNEEEADWRYAYSAGNMQSQVAEALQLPQTCACCGVLTGWYPSRAHMPRAQALRILEEVVNGSVESLPGIQWLELGFISRYFKGFG